MTGRGNAACRRNLVGEEGRVLQSGFGETLFGRPFSAVSIDPAATQERFAA